MRSSSGVKTYRQLYPQVYDFENLFAAYRAARRGKRSKPGVADFIRAGSVRAGINPPPYETAPAEPGFQHAAGWLV